MVYARLHTLLAIHPAFIMNYFTAYGAADLLKALLLTLFVYWGDYAVFIKKAHHITSDTVLDNVIFYVVCSNAVIAQPISVNLRTSVIFASVTDLSFSTVRSGDLKRSLTVQNFIPFKAGDSFGATKRW